MGTKATLHPIQSKLSGFMAEGLLAPWVQGPLPIGRTEQQNASSRSVFCDKRMIKIQKDENLR